MKTTDILLVGGLLVALSAWGRASPPSSPTSSSAQKWGFTDTDRIDLGAKLAAGGSPVIVPPGMEHEAIARLYNRVGDNEAAGIVRDLPHQARSLQRYINRFGLEKTKADPYFLRVGQFAGVW